MSTTGIKSRATRWTRWIAATSLCAWVMLLSGTSTAQAALVVTNFYEEDLEHFDWLFAWDGTDGPLMFAPPAGSTNGIWVPGGPVGGANSPVGGFVGATPLKPGTNLGLTVQHAKGPHTGIDKDPGNPLTLVVVNGDYADVTGAPFSTIFNFNCADCGRKHDPHFDTYSLKYQRFTAGANQPVNFFFSGRHVVPEPASLLLFGSGSLLLLGFGRRRRNNP